MTNKGTENIALKTYHVPALSSNRSIFKCYIIEYA